MQTCSRCIYDDRVSGISFDEAGICNYCKQIDALKADFGTGAPAGETKLMELIERIKRDGKGKRYDCVMGVSGGTDSSYLLLKAKDWGLRVLAVHYDNTWNSAIATMNIKKILDATNFDLYTYVVHNTQVDDIKLSFMKAGVREFDADTDIGFVQVLRSAAAKYRVKYILEGHSFLEEGLTPVGANYLDGGYVSDVHQRFGTMATPSFPNMTFGQFLKWVLIYRQKFIRPLWYISYSKETARDELVQRAGWIYYDGHHLENRASAFAHNIWLPQRFEIDYRNLTLAARVRQNKLNRSRAIQEYSMPVIENKTLRRYLCNRLSLSQNDYNDLMKGEVRNWFDFKNYKKRFEIMRPIFFVLAKLNYVPMSFYQKYCKPIRIEK